MPRLSALLLLASTLVACAGAAPPAPVPAAFLPVDPRVAFVPKAPASSALAAKPPASPIDAELPSRIDALLERRAECRKPTCALRALLPEAVALSANDKAPAQLWEQILAEGSTLSFPRDVEVDLLGVVVGGALELASAGEKAQAPLTMWGAFRAPGAGLSLRAKGGEARVVLVMATSGEPLVEASARLAQHAKEVAWKQRPAPIARIDLNAQPDLAWEGGARHARLGFEPSSSPRASLGLLLLSRDAGVAEHVHDKEWELLAAFEAEGDFVTRAEDKETTTRLADGGLSIVAPGVRHAFRPSGKKRTLGVQVYAPPGPEQRFRKLAGK
jgi:hypothetical protein